MCIKYITFILFFILTTKPFIYWENLPEEERDEIIQDDKTNAKVRDLFLGHFKLGDNIQTRILLDTLTTLPINIKYKALYFNLYNQICHKADGAIIEMLANPCQAILLSDPAYVMNYLKNNPPLLKKYAQILGSEFYFKEEGISDLKYNFKEFKSIIDKTLSNKLEYRDTLAYFYKEIKMQINNME